MNSTMETAVSNFPGFNVETMEEFNAYAEANPNDVILGLEARTFWTGRSGESLAKIGPWSLAGQRIEKSSRDFSIQFGAWKEVEEAIGVIGASDHIEPVEGALAALCSCVNWAICINAAREGVSFDGLEITARATVDPRVLLGIVPVSEAESCMQRVELSINVTGDVSAEDKVRIQQMAKRSPVHALVSHSNSIITRMTNN
jgi:uncharacterized OsmC-like protein